LIQIQTTRNDSPEASFRNPLALMSDCHRRIEMFFDRLLEIARTDRGGALTQSRKEALNTALRYFAAGAPLHTRDEEDSLFPRLRSLGVREAEEALSVVEALEADHREAEEAHGEIDALGERWLSEGSLPIEDANRLISLIVSLRETYRRHIDVEDNQLFPLAGRLLASDALEHVGREMAGRRGLDFDRLPAISRCAQRRIDKNR
jgi:hemerythrin-like domain-containing protein